MEANCRGSPKPTQACVAGEVEFNNCWRNVYADHAPLEVTFFKDKRRIKKNRIYIGRRLVGSLVRLEDDNEMDLKKIGDDLAQDRDHWRALVNVTSTLQVTFS